jgi:hypothetical protein
MSQKIYEVEEDGFKYFFYAKPEHAAFYEVGCTGRVGELYMPMNVDGTPDHTSMVTIEVAYEDC